MPPGRTASMASSASAANPASALTFPSIPSAEQRLRPNDGCILTSQYRPGCSHAPAEEAAPLVAPARQPAMLRLIPPIIRGCPALATRVARADRFPAQSLFRRSSPWQAVEKLAMQLQE